MNNRVPLIIYDEQHVDSLLRKRKGETKLGERTGVLQGNADQTLSERLSVSPQRYVLFGIPEDIGVRANHGRGGAYSAWQPAINTLLNVQSNLFLTGSEILLLGHLDCSELMKSFSDKSFKTEDDFTTARKAVEEIDDAVYPIIEAITDSGKEAIIIGGGHNNCYPLIKGASIALRRKDMELSVINCDAHADLRPREGRHSGNGFTYALDEGYLHRYAITGLHEIFNMNDVIERIKSENDRLKAVFLEEIFIRDQVSWKDAVTECVNFVKADPLGLELDLDCIQNIPASAKTSSSISTMQARQYVHEVASTSKTLYFHLAEAAPVLSHIKTDLKTGKLIAYLVTDYLKARNNWYKNQPL